MLKWGKHDWGKLPLLRGGDMESNSAPSTDPEGESTFPDLQAVVEALARQVADLFCTFDPQGRRGSVEVQRSVWRNSGGSADGKGQEKNADRAGKGKYWRDKRRGGKKGRGSEMDKGEIGRGGVVERWRWT